MAFIGAAYPTLTATISVPADVLEDAEAVLHILFPFAQVQVAIRIGLRSAPVAAAVLPFAGINVAACIARDALSVAAALLVYRTGVVARFATVEAFIVPRGDNFGRDFT